MKRAGSAYLFVLPALAVYALFVILPIGESCRLSLFRWHSAFAPPRFCGLDNFAELFTDNIFWLALWHNVLLLVMSLAVQIPLAIALAVMLSYPTRTQGLFRTAFFAPMIMPTAAIAVLWMAIYEPERGPLAWLVTRLAAGLGVDNLQCLFLASPQTALFWVFVTICWRHTGFHMVLFLAGIAAIPDDLYEAARLDGASEWHVFRHVTLPLLKPALAISATLSIIGSLKYFDLVYIMAEGATEEARELMATYIYRLAFANALGRYGYGSAAAVMLLLVCALVVIPTYAKMGRARQDAEPAAEQAQP